MVPFLTTVHKNVPSRQGLAQKGRRRKGRSGRKEGNKGSQNLHGDYLNCCFGCCELRQEQGEDLPDDA
jgi:hypothetical protein